MDVRRAGEIAGGGAGLDAGDSGKTLSTVSTVSFIAGMGLLGTGIALVLTSNPETGAETALAPVTVHGGGGLRFAGSF